ncbi:SDR family NAD(P)-dependent oxidoreductase [Spongisporangium articulatum]|uniref:SDR family NAD(P)-dependent oxidoreductase n=1 Tax=Spongisporangium articulatum TaxID=3362603 RepID=A0ABW8ALF0_9ACTN
MAGKTSASRVVLITGAASGTGRTTAQELACQGAHLVLLDRDERVRELAHALSGRHEKEHQQ